MSETTSPQPTRIALQQAHRLLVKIGTRLVTSPQGGLDRVFLDRLARQIARLQDRGIEVLVVTSGAVHLGRQVLGGRGKETLTYRQAAAAIGQPELMRNYSEAFGAHRLVAAQVLLTMDDMVDRDRYVNVRNALDLLLKSHIVPIINENDSVSVEGVTFVENDNLAAIVATKMKVDLLVFLSDQPGLCTGNPNVDPEAELICCVLPGADLAANIGDVGGSESRGGMQAKLHAARTAAICGIPVVMADGREENVLLHAAEGEGVGTYFVPGHQTMNGKKPWLAAVRQPVGAIKIDAGAARALQQPDGASLLPRGIVGVTGVFNRGDLVSVVTARGEIARGLVNYSGAELQQIMGRHSREIPSVLGHEGPEEAIHRDNLVLTSD
ncbi:MAG: glutamate 5-kinase [Armatimonadota bacterium]